MRNTTSIGTKTYFCLQGWLTKRFPYEGLKTVSNEGLFQEKKIVLHDNFFQSFQTKKNSFELEFISLIKTSLESAEICYCSCVIITFRFYITIFCAILCWTFFFFLNGFDLEILLLAIILALLKSVIQKKYLSKSNLYECYHSKTKYTRPVDSYTTPRYTVTFILWHNKGTQIRHTTTLPTRIFYRNLGNRLQWNKG